MSGGVCSLVAEVPYLTNVLRGFLMGSADIVPGVSGGTIALLLGIYERLVHNLRTGAGVLGAVLRGRFREVKERWEEIEWSFLLTLLAGILIAIVTLARLLGNLLDDHPQAMAGLFFGLIVASIAIAWGRVREWNDALRVSTAIASVAAFLLLGLRSGDAGDPPTLAFLAVGAVAIMAMILPGISGSFILLMLGMYEAVLAAVNDRELGTLIVFGAGAVLGLVAFSTMLDRLLRHHHDLTMAVLIGVMIGSLRVLWPWPDGTDSAALGRPQDWVVPVLLAVVGAAVIAAIGRYAAVRATSD